jgi:UMF1 family MFS transporter
MGQTVMITEPVAETAIPAALVARRAVVGWVLYDLANTIFSLNIVSLYFTLWVTKDMGGRDGHYLVANAISMGLMFLSAPLLGALSDQTPRRLPFLVFTTIVCCVFTLLLGLGGLWVSLVFFVVANYFYQGGLIFYDALLPVVSTPETRGRIGGIGVGVGYVGSLLGIATGLAVTVTLGEDEKPTIFRLTALLFVLFALPCFLWVKERPRADAVPFGRESARRAWRELGETARRARAYPRLIRFLGGRLFYTDAANTMIAVMGIYATKEVGFSETEVQIVLAVSIVAAVAGGFAWGPQVDRHGPRWVLDRVLGLWCFTLVVTAMIAYLNLSKHLFYGIGMLAGVALAGLWSADRPFMLLLSPPRYLGAFYGLYAMVGRFAAIIGPLLWTLIVDVLRLGRPAAVLSLLGMMAVSYLILRRVSDERPVWGPDELVPIAAAEPALTG